MSACPACASPVSEVQRFCPGCGASLDVAESPTGTAPRPLVPRPDSPSPPRGSSTPRSPRASGPAAARSVGRFAPGTVLGERYRIVGLLGRGGMAGRRPAHRRAIGLAALAFRAAVGGHSGLRRYVAGEAPSSHS